MKSAGASTELRRVIAACRGYFVAAAFFSLAINLLYLAAPIYMLQVYDRVISSASVPTLVMLTLVLLMALAALAGLDVVRGHVLARASVRLDRRLGQRMVAASLDQANAIGARSQPLRDFDTVRQFITGSGVHALFDLPWAPIYLFVIFLLHPLLGAFALASAVVLVLLAVTNEWLIRRPLNEANEIATRNYSFTEMSLRNAEVVRAMGMMEGLTRRWSRDRNRVVERQIAASDRAAAMSGLIKFLRMAMQSVILGLGAYLAIEREVTVGVIFAGSLLLGRSLQPVEQIVASWRGFASARRSYERVRALLAIAPPAAERTTLPRPQGRLAVEGVGFAVAGSPKPILRGVSFQIEAGEVLGIIGPSGAGKSTLARHLVGVLTPTTGAVRLDGADVAEWPRASLGRYLGYLPQDIELFADTVAANISRFQTNADVAVVEAAKLAGVHEMILRLPQGYDTQIGEGGAVLSGGLRQRIALARAIFGEPSIVVLDEPSSNLDSEGDAALADCVVQLKRRGATVVIVSHRPSTLGTVDKLLVMRDGMVDLFGERASVIQRLTRPVPTHAIVAEATPAGRASATGG